MKEVLENVSLLQKSILKYAKMNKEKFVFALQSFFIFLINLGTKDITVVNFGLSQPQVTPLSAYEKNRSILSAANNIIKNY